MDSTELARENADRLRIRKIRLAAITDVGQILQIDSMVQVQQARRALIDIAIDRREYFVQPTVVCLRL